MSHNVTVIAGLSGVGKSYIISRLKERNAYTHFSAGTLINKRKQVQRDSLRSLPESEILRNQYLLLEQFKIELQTADPSVPVLFDAHMLIDSDNEIIIIPLEIFSGLTPSRIIFIHDDAEVIAKRRESDASRKRPNRSNEQLNDQQSQSARLVKQYAEQIGIQYAVIKGADIEAIEKAIAG